MESQLLILLDVGIASVLTSLIGFERESEDKPAGIRTNIIVGGVSCLIISLTTPLIEFLASASHKNMDVVSADPIRVLNALILGVSFVGAGTILKLSDEKRVTGLTTAATLLYSSSIGIAIALKQYGLGIGVVILVILINHLLPKILDKVMKK
jgi:putative Mg2+ transporter-C (MgtC) family protein